MSQKKITSSVISDIVPIFVILFVACSGFLAGYIQNQASNTADQFQSLRIEQENKVNLLTDFLKNAYSDDIETINNADEDINDAGFEFEELLAILNTSGIPAGELAEKNVTHFINIQTRLEKASQKMNETRAWEFYSYFEIEDNEEDFMHAKRILDVFAQNITLKNNGTIIGRCDKTRVK